MFYPVRKTKQALSDDACTDILQHGSDGVLALCDADGWPYAVPLNYVYSEGCLYFHCARIGHKLDAIQANPHASFCVIAKSHIVPEEYTTRFRSVIAFGTIRRLSDNNEKRAALEMLAHKYHPTDSAEHRHHIIEKELAAVTVLTLSIDHLTGKISSPPPEN